MNMQAMMQKVQKMQKEMTKKQEEINNTIFEGKSSFVSVKVKGTKEISEIKIDSEGIEKDEIELLEDMLMVALNDALSKVDKETEEKLGVYTQGMPGLF